MAQLHILVTGSTGFVGSALVPFLAAGGHRVTRLVRATPEHGIAEVQWDPEAGVMDIARLEGLDAVVHLAGENIATGRWTAEKKAKIRDSRVGGTRLLCDSLAGLKQPPKVMVCASAIGYYGDRGDELLTEESAPGTGFLAGVCCEWEAEAKPAVQKGIRVVHPRFGMVLSGAGGALAKLLPPFRMGLGGVLGTGRQYISWIALDDLLGVIAHALATEALQGPVNAVTPNPVTNQEFTQTLGRLLSRVTLFSMPAVAARLAFGEIADEVLLASQRVQPTRLLATGYRFCYPDLEGALRHSLGE
ncbi:TIGR01777 family protein [Candidatus Methylomirabilis limnetica]|uniref:TIGR01777 family protein n=1 Tax=Candidatus Methylomirabilis limnetica TaxID=2033718 RepID=A0A2T4TZ38_9BACT|nr:TIGR01777 family oxidoreductase [Candidatus Methylomirabilis limnetica]PTL36379.1 TIGR01777 family protein [Candidatus Methylomirabilis limnetica]